MILVYAAMIGWFFAACAGNAFARDADAVGLAFFFISFGLVFGALVGVSYL